MANTKKPKAAKRVKRKRTRRPATKDVAQTALDMVERAIGEKLVPPNRSGKA